MTGDAAEAREVALPASLDAWLERIEALHPQGQAGIELGLRRVAQVAERLAQSPFCPLITVGGTNGKGSTCAYLETIYRVAGARVGCYTSPHLLAYNERIRIDGRPADDAAICAAFARVEAARSQSPQVALTYFEFGTLAAFEVFRAAGVEVMILEVGLGGRLDAVNVYTADVAVLTGVAIDHTAFLGTTREAIGFEKAGIFRAGRTAVVADGDPPRSVLEQAARIGAELRLIGRDFGFQRTPGERAQWTYWSNEGGGTSRRSFAYPGLRGWRQLANAAAALAAVEAMRERLPVSMSALRRGLLETELPGRFQILPGRPAVVLDVAHNPQAAATLVENLADMGFHARTLAVVGMMADKDIAATLAPLLPGVDHWFCASLPPPRGADAKLLEATLRGLGAAASTCVADVREACRLAVEAAGEADRIIVFGSFVTVAAAMRQLVRRPSHG